MQSIHPNTLKQLASAIGEALAQRLTDAFPTHVIACLLRDPDWLDRGITEVEAAAFLGLEVSTLQAWRVRGGGPLFIRPSQRCIRYRRRDLISWQDAHLVANTGQVPDSLSKHELEAFVPPRAKRGTGEREVEGG